MLNNLHAFGHKVHKVCIFYNGDRAERMRVCVSALAQYHIQAFYFISCSVRTENDFFFPFSLRFYFSSSFIRSSSCSSICVLFVQLPNNQRSEPFSLLFTFMMSHILPPTPPPPPPPPPPPLFSLQNYIFQIALNNHLLTKMLHYFFSPHHVTIPSTVSTECDYGFACCRFFFFFMQAKFPMKNLAAS